MYLFRMDLHGKHRFSLNMISWGSMVVSHSCWACQVPLHSCGLVVLVPVLPQATSNGSPLLALISFVAALLPCEGSFHGTPVCFFTSLRMIG
ncbi:hypothetical protein BDV28DRAFT_131926 [Aspergillus coremiiformis]|uniref:Uncharacterized protein n=1 Tax=Aspergillus coremiiformis TaxID=138285 RepID=A0A5N6ZBC0_9EURO|nr:hypothetical protein BDV28DRAFT_131926 [Aspergillus coremiiformis]